MIRTLLFVAMGGAVGSALRYLSSSWVQTWNQGTFPVGTLTVNVLGSLLMGTLYFTLAERHILTAEWLAFVLVGGLGGFTTFSTFSLDTLSLFMQGSLLRAVGYVLLSLGLCLTGVTVGYRISRLLI